MTKRSVNSRKAESAMRIQSDEGTRKTPNKDGSTARNIAKEKKKIEHLVKKTQDEGLAREFIKEFQEILREHTRIEFVKFAAKGKSQELFEEAISTAKAIKDDYQMVHSIRNIAEEMARVDVEKATVVFDKAISAARNMHRGVDKTKAITRIAETLSRIDRRKAKKLLYETGITAQNTDKSNSSWSSDGTLRETVKIDLDKILDILEQTDSDYEKANILTDVAVQLYDKNVGKARALFDTAITTARRITNNVQKACCLSGLIKKLADIDFKLARKLLDEAITAAKGVNGSIAKAACMEAVGSAILKIDSQKAEKILNEAAEAARNIDDDNCKVTDLVIIGSFISKVDLQKAEDLFDEAVILARDINKDVRKAARLSDIARRYAIMKGETISEAIPLPLLESAVMKYGTKYAEKLWRYAPIFENYLILSKRGINVRLPHKVEELEGFKREVGSARA